MNTIAMPQPNKPARYLFDGNLAVPVEEDQSAAAPELPPADAIGALVALFADPAATKKRIDEFASAAAKARDAIAAAKKAQGDLDRVNAEIAKAKKQHDEKLAGELAAHAAELQQRTRDNEARAQDLTKREAILDQREAKLKADRERVNKKLAAIAAAATD